jgi:hypothetical protein
MSGIEINNYCPEEFINFVNTRQCLLKAIKEKKAFDKKVLEFNNRELQALDYLLGKINAGLISPKVKITKRNSPVKPKIFEKDKADKLRAMRLKAIASLGYDISSVSDFTNDDLLALEILLIQIKNSEIKRGRKRTKIV